MVKSCASCGRKFEPKRPNGKYCGPTCRQRAHRAPKPTEAEQDAPVVTLPTPVVEGGTAASTRAELDAAGRLDTAAGQAALTLARRIDDCGSETGASLAALVKQHLATLQMATAGAERAADPIDELRARRERRLGAG